MKRAPANADRVPAKVAALLARGVDPNQPGRQTFPQLPFVAAVRSSSSSVTSPTCTCRITAWYAKAEVAARRGHQCAAGHAAAAVLLARCGARTDLQCWQPPGIGGASAAGARSVFVGAAMETSCWDLGRCPTGNGR